MTATLIGNNARTEHVRNLCQQLNEKFCQQDAKIVGLEKALGLCPTHLKITDKLFDYPQSYGCPQCQRNRTCELEELAAELLRCLRAIVIAEQVIPKQIANDERARVFRMAANAIEHMDDFMARDVPGGCLDEKPVANGTETQDCSAAQPATEQPRIWRILDRNGVPYFTQLTSKAEALDWYRQPNASGIQYSTDNGKTLVDEQAEREGE